MAKKTTLSTKYAAISCLLILLAFGCARNETASRLITDQKLLKDSAAGIGKRIDYYLRNGIYDSAELQKKQLAAVYARLIEIQASIDRRSK